MTSKDAVSEKKPARLNLEILSPRVKLDTTF